MIIVSLKFFVPQTILNKNASDYTNKYSLNWEASRISDEYMPKNFLKPSGPYGIPDVKNLVTKEIEVVIASSEFAHYAEEISFQMEESAKARGTGIAKRPPEYLVQKKERTRPPLFIKS